MDIYERIELFLLIGCLLLGLVLVFLTAIAYFLYLRKYRRSYSPYTRQKLVLPDEIAYDRCEKLAIFLYELPFQKISSFRLDRVAVCKYSGKIFPTSFDGKKINYFLGSEWVIAVGENSSPISWNQWEKKFSVWEHLSKEKQEELQLRHPKIIQTFIPYQITTPMSSKEIIYHSQWITSLIGPFALHRQSDRLYGWFTVPRTMLQLLLPVDALPEKLFSPN